MLLLWAPLAGVAGEEIGSPEVGAAAVSGARLPHLPGSLPAPREERGQGMGVHVGGIGKPPCRCFLFLLCSPGLLSGALLRPPGTWLWPPRPSVAPCRPRPGLGSPRLPACQEAPGVPVCGQRDPGAMEVGCRGEAPVKFSEPQAGVEVRLVDSGGVCLGGTVLFLSDSGQPRGETPSKGVYLEAMVGGEKQLLSLLFHLFLLAWCGG